MKRNILLITLPFLTSSLLGCNSTTSESKEEIKNLIFSEILANLQTGYNLELISNTKYKVTGGSGSETVYKSIENVMDSDGKYRHISYMSTTDETPSKDTISSDEYYERIDDKLIKHTLSLENKVLSENVIKDNKEVSWNSSNLSNAFSLLEEEDFQENNGTYSLNSKINALTRMHLITQLKGYPYTSGLSLETFSLTPNDDGTIDFSASFEPYTINYVTDIEVSESFEGTFLSIGEDVTPLSPIEKEEDSAFKNAFAKLSSLNFKTTVKNSEIHYKDGRYETVATAESKISSNDFSYTFYDKNNKISEDSIYYVNEGGIQKVAKYGDKLFASGKKEDASLSSYWPSFKISNAFFNKENNTYTLNKKYLGYFSSTRLFTPFVSDKVDDLKITIDDDKINIVNENDGNGATIFKAKEEITYEGFGTQEDIDTSKVSFDSSSLTWAEAIRNSKDYKDLATAMGGINYLNLIPYFGGLYSEASVELGSEFEYIYTRIDSLSEATALKERYATELPKNGFVADTDANGETSYLLQIDEKKTLEIYPVAFEDQNILTGQYTGIYYFALSFLLTESK